jgi:general secretion pathway protein C
MNVPLRPLFSGIRPVLLAGVLATAVVATLVVAHGGAIFRSRPPRFCDAAIHCEHNHCSVDRMRMRGLLEGGIGLANTRLGPIFAHPRMTGVHLFMVRPGSLLARLGFRNGDDLRRVNGVELSSPERAIELYRSLHTARHVVVELERAGRPMILTYTIQ